VSSKAATWSMFCSEVSHLSRLLYEVFDKEENERKAEAEMAMAYEP
jgi:hypothetical protein